MISYLGQTIYKIISIRGSVNLAFAATTALYIRKAGFLLLGPNSNQNMGVVYL
jgi:hypothetical protein